MTDKRFIEETFPVKEVGEASASEKNIRYGHISTLHIWWARRPLASSRATAYATLIPAASNSVESEKKRQFISKLSKWEETSDSGFIQRARKDIVDAYGERPKVLDPFAGGGSIALEALRLECETYASDYNPVAVFILKCSLEYPQRFGSKRNKTELAEIDEPSSLQEDIKKWSGRMLEEVVREIGRFYVDQGGRLVTVGYIWANTVPCQNPTCGVEIPLLRQYWLSNTDNRKVSLCPLVSEKQVKFRIVGTGYQTLPKGFDPSKGTVSKAIATCLVCRSVLDSEAMKNLFVNGKAKEKMIAIVLRKEGTNGKEFRIADDVDYSLFRETSKYLEDKRRILLADWGLDPVPDEPTPEGKGRGAERAFSLRNYNLNTWADLFNTRQKLALITLVEKARQVYREMLDEGISAEYAKVITSYLAVLIDGVADHNSRICQWRGGTEDGGHTFGRQTLSTSWDYFEINPISNSTGSIQSGVERLLRVVQHLSSASSTPARVTQSSATSLSFPDNFFDAVLTDPPYYDNVPYSYLSDFFYVWLKRSMGNLEPELFATPLTPKKEEIVAYSNVEGGFEGGKQFFENMLKKSFMEVNRVLKPNGISVIVYAHKSTAGWETLVNSLLDSGLVVTGAWPIHTEMGSRLRAAESAALASSIYMIARKSSREQAGFYNEVRREIKTHLNKKLNSLWTEGISGADFFIAAIGSSIEVFGKYNRIIDDEGNVIRADRLLEDIRKIVTDYAVKQVLHNGIAGEISPKSRFYVLWRWAYGEAKVKFDDANKLAQGVGIDLPQEWNKGFIWKEKEFIELLGPEGRQTNQLENSTELIDVLHHVLLLWKKGMFDEGTRVLGDSGYGRSDVLYKVAQAISESLPNDSKEKKLLEGFLAGKERITRALGKETGQTRLPE